MKKKIMPVMAPMLLLMMSVGCSQVPAAPAERPALSAEKKNRLQMNQSLSGSYIVKAAGDGEQSIQQVFAEYGVTSVHAMGNELYEFRLSRDPGIEILKSKAGNSDGVIQSIQPNFIYRVN